VDERIRGLFYIIETTNKHKQMKIKHAKIERKTIGDGFDDTIQAGIRQDDLGLAFTMVSKNLYSNPIGSFIREITANAVDANYEAGHNHPVVIHIYNEDDTPYISFKDQGTGISPDRFKQIYMNIFASDKRDSNDKIGGWGIGSKSPLAYQEFFELITIHDGVKYHYLLDNSDTNLKAELLVEEDTLEHSGTTVIVELKPEDLLAVNKACHQQLSYFTDIYVQDENYYFDNEYTIYDAGDFLLKDKERPFDVMHLSINGVPYPINWRTLELEPYAVPVALKCTFEELDVTLSRESINYTEDVKEYLIERITKATEYFDSLYEEGLKTDDPVEFVTMNRKGNDFHVLSIGDIDLQVRLSNAKPTYTPLNLKLPKRNLYDVLVNVYDVVEFSNETIRTYRRYQDLAYALANKSRMYYTEKDRPSKYDLLAAGHGNLIKKKKLNKNDFYELAYALGYAERNRDAPSWGTPTRRYILKDGSVKAVYEWNKALNESIKNRSHVHLLDGYADEEWIEEYKAEQKRIRLERKELITYYDYYNSMHKTKYGDLIDKYKAIFLIDKKEDKERTMAYHTLLENAPYNKRFKLLIVTPTTLSKLIKKDKCYHAKSIFKVKSLHNYFCRLRLYDAFSRNIKEHRSLIKKYSTYYSNMWDTLAKTYLSYSYAATYYEIPTTTKEFTKTYHINLPEYFNKELSEIYPNTFDKMLYNEHLFVPLMMFIERIKDAKWINDSAPLEVTQRFLSTMKCLKLDNKYYHSSLLLTPKTNENGNN